MTRPLWPQRNKVQEMRQNGAKKASISGCYWQRVMSASYPRYNQPLAAADDFAQALSRDETKRKTQVRESSFDGYAF